MNKKVEILAPAGSYESMIAAVSAGADAIYIGGTRFGARAYADNLDEEQMLRAIDYVHMYGKKIYLTINTLLKEDELSNQLYQYLLPYYKHGIDAVIVQDIGVLRYIKEQFPDLPIHASTQMTITNVNGAKMLERLGVERVVTARELQCNEIKEISEQTNLEIESFVHGALCYSYSGQCLFSSMLGGRSGNRGQCAQPCRLPYWVEDTKKSQYILSLKDICTLEQIPNLIEAGISSFKIEGRMKKPEYVALVTAMYRKYVDLFFKVGKEKYAVNPKDNEKLMDLYNRGGFCGGYYETKNGPEMLSLSRPNHAGVPAIRVLEKRGKAILIQALVDIHRGDVIELVNREDTYTFGTDVPKGKTVEIVTNKKQDVYKGNILNRTRNEQLICDIKSNIIERPIKILIDGTITILPFEPMKLTLSYKDVRVVVKGDVAQQANNQPLECERIEKQMRKTGGTVFEFRNLNVFLGESVFVPMQSLNDLRRKGLELLEDTWLSQFKRTEVEQIVPVATKYNTQINEVKIHVGVSSYEQWEEVLKHKNIDRIYLESSAVEDIFHKEKVVEMISQARRAGKEIFLAMPHIFRKATIEKFEKHYQRLFACEWDGVLIRNYEEFNFLKAHGYLKEIVADSHLYTFNGWAKRFWREEGVVKNVAPLELNIKELETLGVESSELLVYGYTPMMISAQCIQKSTRGCDKCKKQIKLQDRYRKKFIAVNYCEYCYNIIYNSSPTSLLDQVKEIQSLNPKALRMNFTIENRKTTCETLKMFTDVYKNNSKLPTTEFDFTRGHFKRGVK